MFSIHCLVGVVCDYKHVVMHHVTVRSVVRDLCFLQVTDRDVVVIYEGTFDTFDFASW